MKKRRSILLVVALVLMILLSVHLTFYWATERSLIAKRAQVRRPESLAFYEKLEAELSRGEVPADTSSSLRDDTGQSGMKAKDVAEALLAYERFRAEVDEQWGGVCLPGSTTDIVNKHSRSWTDAERETVRQIVEERQPLIQTIRELAQYGGPFAVLELSEGHAMDLAHLARLRAAARLLRADAIIKAAEGNYTEAVEDIIAGMKLADAVVHEPVLISQLVRIAVHSIMNATLQESVSGDELPSDLASDLVSYMAGAGNRHAFAESFAGEATIGLQKFSDIRAGNLTIIESFTNVDIYGPFLNFKSFRSFMGSAFARLYESPLGHPWVNMDESMYLDIMNRLTAAAELPYYEVHPQLEQIESEMVDPPRTRPLSAILMPSPRSFLAQARHEAQLDLAQMGLLVEQYQAEYGMFPETLDAIAPGLDGSVPVDPFTGEPYRYEPSGDTFLLYSVGENMTDDGGQHDMREGDVVWRGESE